MLRSRELRDLIAPRPTNRVPDTIWYSPYPCEPHAARRYKQRFSHLPEQMQIAAADRQHFSPPFQVHVGGFVLIARDVTHCA